MRTITLTKGVPGSGKSTWALEQMSLFPRKYKRVNRDLMRIMIDNNPNITFHQSDENFITEVRVPIIERALTKGCDVIVDDTNFRKDTFEQMCDIAERIGDVLVQEKFFDVDPQVAIERNQNRAAKVPEEVILRMHNKYVKGKKVEEKAIYFPAIKKTFSLDSNKKSAIIVDIDGTLAHAYSGRNIYDNNRVNEDTVDEHIKQLVNILSKTFEVIVVSGRKEITKEMTEQWLKDNNVTYHQIFITRKIEDNRRDVVLKKEIYKNNIEAYYNVVYVIDDRPSVVRMWRSLGLTVLQVDDVPF